MDDIRALDNAYIWHPFTQAQTACARTVITRGQGIYLFDDNGKRYQDLISSWWVTLHGHGHPKIAAAINKQAQQLEQVIFTDFTHPPATLLATQLIKQLQTPFTKVFFSDNGSTAVEVALKLAYQFFYNQKQQRCRFIAFDRGYHGDTFGAMSAGTGSRFFTPFSPLCFAVDTLSYPNTFLADANVQNKEQASLEQLRQYLAQYACQTAALIVEPLIQGAGGMRMCRPQFLDACIALCHAHDVLVIFDEVMTGFGRTGSLFACHQCNEKPDIICLSKGITAGFLPLAVTITTKRIFDGFLDASFDKAFAHGHSFTANPLGCAAALASLTLFSDGTLLDSVARIQELHYKWMQHFAHQGFGEQPRVTGSVAAISLKSAESGYTASIGKLIKQQAWDMGMLLRPLGTELYLLPPLCITLDELETAYSNIQTILTKIYAKRPI